MSATSPEDSFWWPARTADETAPARQQILQAAYREIHVHGFQAASLSRILARTGVSKGALYHYFPNKTELGYAVVDELLAQRIEERFILPLIRAEDPVEALVEIIVRSGEALTLGDIELGCPLSTLAQEMSSLDEGFHQRLLAIHERWRETLLQTLVRAQSVGRIDSSVDAEVVSVMVLSTLEGCLQTGKITRSLDRLRQCGLGLIHYLRSLQRQPE